MASMLLISHADGRAYAVTAAEFRKGADDQFKGFRVDGHEDGSEYDGPKTAAAITREHEAPKSTPKADAPKDEK